MQVRMNSQAVTALVMLLFAAIPATASEMLPRYKITDLGPVQESIFVKVKFDANGNLVGKPSAQVAGRYSVGHLTAPELPAVLTGTYLRQEGESDNLLPLGMQQSILYLGGVSANGEVVGTIHDDWARGKIIPFYFDSKSGFLSYMKISALTYGWPIVPRGINDLHQIVGANVAEEGIILPNPLADPVLLSSLVDDLGGWRLHGAEDIDNLGRIIGTGFRTDLQTDQHRYYRLDPIPTPVPEPTSLCFFAAITGLVVARHKRSLRRLTA